MKGWMMDAEQRYIGMDIHKGQITVAGVNRQQEVILEPCAIRMKTFTKWARARLNPNDKIVFEATTNAWHIYDELVDLGLDVVVANTHKVKLISTSRTKTDKHDALVLAKLHAANLVPEIWVPPVAVRELRSLVAHQDALMTQRTAAKNRLHSLLHRHNLEAPSGDLFRQELRPWWASQPFTPIEHLRAQQDLAHVDHLNDLLKTTDLEMLHLSRQEPWRDQVGLLIQMPGIALQSAMIILSAIGDISRFAAPDKLVGYSGLGGSIHASGNTTRTGGITKQGRRELRKVLVESAWAAVRYSDYWRGVYTHFAQRKPKNKAIVAVARKMLVVVWHVLSKKVVDRHAEPEAIARSLYRWGAAYRTATSLGMSRAEFTWHELDRLGLGDKIACFECSGQTVKRPAASDGSLAARGA